MLKFKEASMLHNVAISNQILAYYNEKNNEEFFFNDMVEYLFNITGIDKKNATAEKISDTEEILLDFKKSNLDSDNFFDYMKIASALSRFENQLQLIKAKINKKYFEVPLSAYEYIGNNKTKFIKNDKLSSILYR